VLNALYRFRGTPTSLSSIPFVSPVFSGMPKTVTNGIVSGNRFDRTWIGKIPLPIPRDFLIGLDSQLLDQQAGAFGNLEHGNLVPDCPWYAPLRTLVYKLPLGTLILAGFSLSYWLYHASRGRFPNALIVTIPVLFVLLLCVEGGSLKSSLRYSLPALPFFIILMGQPLQVGLSHKPSCIVIAACLFGNVVSLIRAYPSYIAYGNELVGGHAGAQQRFLGSNFDWGQDLFLLKRWSDEHPDLGPLALTYYGSLHPAEIELNTRPLPESFSRPYALSSRSSKDGFYWAVSSNVLHGLPGILDIEGSTITQGKLKQELLTKDSAVARIGQTLFVFRVYPEGVAKPPGAISVEMLAGCIRPLGPDDLIAAP
jgi:hypothetical protein